MMILRAGLGVLDSAFRIVMQDKIGTRILALVSPILILMNLLIPDLLLAMFYVTACVLVAFLNFGRGVRFGRRGVRGNIVTNFGVGQAHA